MKRKELGLLVALATLAFMAVFSEKRILVAEGLAVTAEDLEVGRRIYEEVCRPCHAEGSEGAPRLGDTGTWKKRTAAGIHLLVTHAIEGFRGKTGWMPPRGGAPLSSQEVELAVAYMLHQAQP